jgi:hypothetical protein
MTGLEISGLAAQYYQPMQKKTIESALCLGLGFVYAVPVETPYSLDL